MSGPASLPVALRRLAPRGVSVTDCGPDRCANFWRFKVGRGAREAPLVVTRREATGAHSPRALAGIMAEAVARIDDYDGAEPVWRHEYDRAAERAGKPGNDDPGAENGRRPCA